jgi:beta-glucosidase
MIFHGNCADDRDAARQGIEAGCDMDMASRCFPDHLPQLANDGGVAMAVLDEAVRRVLLVKHRLGLFDRPYADAPKVSVALSEAHRGVARELVRESLVLLKNEGAVLPLSPSAPLAVVGPLADDGLEQLGCWSFDGRARDSITILSAIRDRVGAGAAKTVHFAKGLPDARSTDVSGFDEAVRAAESAAVTLAFVGENANLSGECRSRAFLDLPGAQLALLQRLAATKRPLVVVVMAGRPLVLGPVADLATAVVYAWHPGTMAGPGIADVLFGDVAPSGKLPMSFPRAVGQIPVYYNFKNTGRPPTKESKGIPTGTPLDPVGFEATYLDVEVTPQYPFGFGLSYTTFGYDGLSIAPKRARLGEAVTVRATVRNTGKLAGVETVQLYVRDRVGSVTRPVRELKAFRRVALEPGAAAALEFTLTKDDLAFPGHDMRGTIEPGTFEVFVGGDARAALSTEFELV